MHIAQGVLRAINVNKLTSTGCLFKFWVADWFAQLNNKMDGDLKKIRMIGQYMIEIWKAIGESTGVCLPFFVYYAPQLVQFFAAIFLLKITDNFLLFCFILRISLCTLFYSQAWTCRMCGSCGPRTRSTRTPRSTGASSWTSRASTTCPASRYYLFECSCIKVVVIAKFQ